MTDHATLRGMEFDQLFQPISPEEIRDNVFTLTGKVFPVVTAGTRAHFNSMLASGGGFGLLFMKPSAWCILREDRYTLELIQKEKAYTFSYFPDAYAKQALFLGSKSGRDSEKMMEVELTGVQTPCGTMAFKEARLILSCKLTALATISPDDFCTQEAKDLINEAYREANVYRKYVFGEITHVWTRRDGTP